MNLSSFRAKAREKLSEKWGKAACITLAYMAINFIFNTILSYSFNGLNTILSIGFAIINVPLAYGLLIQFVKLYNGEDTSAFNFFTLGFNNFARAWKVALNVFLKLLVPFILLIISSILLTSLGIVFYWTQPANLTVLLICLAIVCPVSLIWLIVKSYYYIMSDVISIEETELQPKDAVAKSKELMTNNRWKFFILDLSFIGWALLASLTFGIGMLWLLPYIQLTHIAFYKHISKKEDVI